MFTAESLTIGSTAIMLLTSICSWMGFRDPAFRDRHLFSVQEILVGKKYHRLFTSALLHADWNHLLLNMITLFFFGPRLESALGVWNFLWVYLAAVLGGSVLSLWLHRHHEYTAYGASGGVCGLVFSHILLFPGGKLMLFPLPVGVPAWLYAVLFLGGSMLALKRQADNVGHDAHLGGAVIGLWTTAAFEPDSVRMHPGLFLGISAAAVVLMLYLIRNPLFLPLSGLQPCEPDREGKPPKPLARPDEALELDAILEKISRDGMESLSRKEKARLNSAAEELQRRADSSRSDKDSKS
jgi:membrane associated rhomboid family serine protease